jgi:plastocyanin
MAFRPALLLIGCLILGAVLDVVASEENISGQLVITRTLTKQRVVLPAYQDRGVALHKHEEVSAKPVNEWERVVVYLEGDRAPRATPVTATMTQHGEHFDPEILIVPAGSTVSFPNADPIFHNVFSLSKVREFDLGFYPAGETRSVKFDKPGIVQVYCHLHPEMNASILVVPNAWYTRPTSQGAFSFTGIAAGSYQVVAWHRSAGFFRKQIQVPQNGTVKVSMEIPIGANEP